MKPLSFILLLLTSVKLLAQSEEPDHWVIGGQFSPDYSFRTLYKSESSKVNDFIYKFRNHSELPDFGYTFGIPVIYKFTNKTFELESGIFYSRKGYKAVIEAVESDPPGRSFPNFEAHYHYHCLEIPFRLNAGKNLGKIRLFATAGITGTYFIQENDYAFYKPKADTYYDYKKFWLNGEAGIGISGKICSRFGYRIMPIFRYGFTKIIDAPITARLWSFGVNSGITMDL